MSATNGKILETGAASARHLEERACVAAVCGAGALVAGIECPIAPIRPEVRPVPKGHHSEHAFPDPHFPCRAVPFQQMQFFKTFKNPEREIDIDAERI